MRLCVCVFTRWLLRHLVLWLDVDGTGYGSTGDKSSVDDDEEMASPQPFSAISIASCMIPKIKSMSTVTLPTSLLLVSLSVSFTSASP